VLPLGIAGNVHDISSVHPSVRPSVRDLSAARARAAANTRAATAPAAGPAAVLVAAPTAIATATASHAVPATALSRAAALFANPPSAPSAPSAPRPPSVPSAPSATSALSAPSAPSVPSAPSAPSAPLASAARAARAARAALSTFVAAPSAAPPPAPPAAAPAAAAPTAASLLPPTAVAAAAAYATRAGVARGSEVPEAQALAQAQARAQAHTSSWVVDGAVQEAAQEAAAAEQAARRQAWQTQLQVRLLGAEQIRGREHYTAYKLQRLGDADKHGRREPEGKPLYRRFRQFVQLVASLLEVCTQVAGATSRTSEPLAEPLAELRGPGAEQLHEWRRRLLAEKRRVGVLALKPEVVHTRCALLQQLLDMLCRPPYCATFEVRAFCGLDGLDGLDGGGGGGGGGSGAVAQHAPAQRGTAEGGAVAPPAVQYGATCPSCRRTLRVTAPPNAREAAALFRCPGCETVFKVALQP